MTILLNVTDALSTASNHGITRTERQLAAALAGRADVQFVAMRGGRMGTVEHDHLVAGLGVVNAEQPRVERLGSDPAPPPSTGRRAAVRRTLARVRRRAASPALVPLGPLSAAPGDVLVSVGLDWVHGLLGEAERLVFGSGVRYLGFCYDMIPADHPEWLFPPDPLGFLQHFQRLTRVADAVLCISDSTRRDFNRHFPTYGAERVHVLPLGADAAISTLPEHDRFAAELFGGEPYAVYCATLDRRKNHQVLYRAAKEMARRGAAGNIAFVGMLGNGVGDLMDSLRHDPLVAGRFCHVTRCDDAHLAAIYRRARFAVYPSLYEGWGLGVTEALAHGKPCLIASGSSLGEAGLGVCRQLHPLRTSDWVEAMTAYFEAAPEVPPVEIPTWRDAATALIEMVAA